MSNFSCFFTATIFFSRTRENESPLQLAVKRHMPVIVDALCKAGADVNAVDDNGNSILWMALESGQEDVASILVLSFY